jgi:hypothetical protein
LFVPEDRIELPHKDFQSFALPLSYSGQSQRQPFLHLRFHYVFLGIQGPPPLHKPNLNDFKD